MEFLILDIEGHSNNYTFVKVCFLKFTLIRGVDTNICLGFLLGRNAQIQKIRVFGKPQSLAILKM